MRSEYGASIPAPAHEAARARLAAIVHAYGRSALGEFEGDCEADEPGTDHDDVAATIIHQSPALTRLHRVQLSLSRAPPAPYSDSPRARKRRAPLP